MFSIFQIFMNIWKVDSIFSQELLAAVKKKKKGQEMKEQKELKCPQITEHSLTNVSMFFVLVLVLENMSSSCIIIVCVRDTMYF